MLNRLRSQVQETNRYSIMFLFFLSCHHIVYLFPQACRFTQLRAFLLCLGGWGKAMLKEHDGIDIKCLALVSFGFLRTEVSPPTHTDQNAQMSKIFEFKHFILKTL